MNQEGTGVLQMRSFTAPADVGNSPGSELRDFARGGGRSPDEPAVNITDLWRVIVKWWWLIAAVLLACVLAAVTLSMLVTPQYRATSLIEVSGEGVQVVEVGQLQPMQMQDRDFINTQVGLIRSRALAERVVRSLSLANNPDFVSTSDGEANSEGMAVDTLLENLTVEPVRDSRLINVSVASTDPSLAAKIANEYGAAAIRMDLERKYEATSYARKFLEERLDTVRERLESSERQLVAYARQQGIVSLNADSGDDASTRNEQSLDAASLVALNGNLQQAKSDRITAEQRYRQAQANASTTEALNNPAIQTLTTERAKLQAEYQQKLALFKPDYPEMVQLRSQIQSLSSAIAQETGRVSNSLRSDFVAAAARENALARQVDALRASLLNLRDRSIQYTILQRDVDTNRTLYDGLLQRYKEVGIAGGVGSSSISVADRADAPTTPFKPDLPFNVALGLLAGLLLGFGLAFGIEWMDDTIKTPDDLRDKLGLAPLGVIPRSEKGVTVQEELADPRSQISEAYQSVRTALQFSTEHGVPKSLAFTSTRAAEGKSSSALALARTIASLGGRVLLIDADLRKPTFRGPSKATGGLTSLLTGGESLADCIHKTENEGLYLLPAGKVPPNPAELLSSDRFGVVIRSAHDMFDYVIVDGPPVLGLADAPLIASQCEGAIMVVEAGEIRRVAALSALSRLRSAHVQLMGGILTKFSATKSGYGYGYGYGYGDDAYSYREGDEAKKQIDL